MACISASLHTLRTQRSSLSASRLEGLWRMPSTTTRSCCGTALHAMKSGASTGPCVGVSPRCAHVEEGGVVLRHGARNSSPVRNSAPDKPVVCRVIRAPVPRMHGMCCSCARMSGLSPTTCVWACNHVTMYTGCGCFNRTKCSRCVLSVNAEARQCGADDSDWVTRRPERQSMASQRVDAGGMEDAS